MSQAGFFLISQLWLLSRRLFAIPRLDGVKNAIVERLKGAVLKSGRPRDELRVVVVEENERLGAERLGALNERIVGGGSVGGGTHKEDRTVRKTRALGSAHLLSPRNAREVCEQ